MKTNLVVEPQEESQAQEPSLEDELRPIEAAKHVARAKHHYLPVPEDAMRFTIRL
jgi:hypothetical protein